MRECPWCHHMNLNVYAYCMSCGRGFDGPPASTPKKEGGKKFHFWPFTSHPAG